jgi:hypothetical protein
LGTYGKLVGENKDLDDYSTCILGRANYKI